MSADPKQITVLRPGCAVDIGGVFATVTQVCITDTLAVTYECVWWSSNERRTAWVSAAQITTTKAERTAIGFGGTSR